MTPWKLLALTVALFGGTRLHAEEFARAGRWTIFKDSSTCSAGTTTAGVTVGFIVSPRPVLIIQSNQWKIPAGQYPIGIDYLESFIERSVSASSHVTADRPDRFLIEWQSAADLVKLVSFGWLRFHIGGHDMLVNTDGAAAARMLPICGQNASDPFATIH